MAKVTRKYQVSVPRDLARACGIKPGDSLEWQAAGSDLRVWPVKRGVRRDVKGLPVAARLAARGGEGAVSGSDDRGWSRDDLYADRLNRFK